MNHEDIKKALTGRRPQIMESKRRHAVLLPLIQGEEGLCLVFEKRAGDIIQGGELCFPGGKIEEGESPLEAALREFEEETGMPASEAQVLGEYDTLVTYGLLAIHTFIALLPPDAMERFKPNPAEVERMLLIPLSYLKDNPPVEFNFPLKPDLGNAEEMYEFIGIDDSYKWRKGSLYLPCWKYDGEVLWGISGRITRYFIKDFC